MFKIIHLLQSISTTLANRKERLSMCTYIFMEFLVVLFHLTLGSGRVIFVMQSSTALVFLIAEVFKTSPNVLS